MLGPKLLALILVVSVFSACADESSSNSGVEADAEADANEEADVNEEADARADMSRDARLDTADEPSEDVRMDIEPDTPMDTAADPDVSTDSFADVPLDADAEDGLSCDPPTRCRSRIVDACVPGTQEYVEDHVCERTEACVAGACETLPEVYDAPCRTRDDTARCAAAGLVCGGHAAIPFCLHPAVPVSQNGECWGSRDCEPGLLCTRTGYCQLGAAGDPCVEPEDCAENGPCTDDGVCG